MSKKRYLAAFGAAGLVFAGVFGAAAALQVDGDAIQAGQDGSLQCDTDGVRVESYQYEADAALSYGVRVVGISSDCHGQELFADAFRGGDRLTGGSASISSTVANVKWDNPVSARDITRVQLAID